MQLPFPDDRAVIARRIPIGDPVSSSTYTIETNVDGEWVTTMALHLNLEPTDAELVELGRAVHIGTSS